MENLDTIAQAYFERSIDELTDAEVYAVLLQYIKRRTKEMPLNQSKRKLYYISAEFLLGKLLTTNLINLGAYDEIKEELANHGRSLADIEDAEVEPSLGNGGLGRLAACFMDSIASLGLNGDGVGLNYHFGLFRQFFRNNQQRYEPDEWLNHPNWLTRTSTHYNIPFGRYTVQSAMYEIDVIGYDKRHRNRIRLFDLDSVDPMIIQDGSIAFDKNDVMHNLTLFLYPDDSDHAGKVLRVYQQYFMVSNAAQLIIDEAIARGSNLHDLADYAVIQINDTHPTLVIPEMIRLLNRVHHLDFDESIRIVQKMLAFTNHTILAEALETWTMTDLYEVCPDVADIIRALDAKMKEKFPDNEAVAIIDNYDVAHMAHMAIHFGFSINGVSKLHTEILKDSELKPFYEIYPEKFNNKTNGITFRRWLTASNPELSHLLDETIGTEWHKDGDLTALTAYKEDDVVLERLYTIKQDNKRRLAEHLKRTQNLYIHEHAIIDVQIKRIHEYKRQQMLALYLIHKYMDIKQGNKPETPVTVIFGGKAAPAYVIARDIIHMILTLSQVIANDPEVSPYLQVFFVENYNVTEAEYLIPAADLSEQISLASKEASGTSNMKFMLNGAVTICTLDGANVEIAELAGEDNIYTFGQASETIVDLYATNGYHPEEYYNRPTIQPLVDFIVSSQMKQYGVSDRLERLYNDIKGKDYFMALIDLEEFITVKEQVYKDYEDHQAWAKRSLMNIAKAGHFSSDRTINEYNDDIWHLEKQD
ncbi:MAG: glycogen/starch/alpha-glucan phosphorylase [Aerococcus sp.]|nr:glycogen/starch/alpha-glucan phosphorylase [Aerococcus sp.]